MSCSTTGQNLPQGKSSVTGDKIVPISKPDTAWKRILNPEAYSVLRQGATERPFTGKWLQNNSEGEYVCAACGLVLFQSDTKFDAGCGWPSFYEAIDKSHIVEIPDYSLGMKRIELRCARCGGHLGHVFKDGPKPTGLRYCINSVSLDFVPENKKTK